MNQFFSFKRFQLLVAKHWAENKKRYGLSLLAFLGLLLAWFILTIITSDTNELMSVDVQKTTYFLMLFALGTFHASQYFRDLGSKAKGTNFLLVPASAFEKILCSLLYSIFMFFIAFTTAFYLVNILMITISNNLYGDEILREPALLNVFEVTFFRFQNGLETNILLFFFVVQSAFLFGSVYFEKYSFIKTIISGFIICFVLFCLIYFLYRPLFPTTYHHELLVQVPDWLAQLFHFLLYAIGPLLWMVTYYRLKLKQV